MGLNHDLLLSEKGRFKKSERPFSAPEGALRDIIDIDDIEALSPKYGFRKNSRLGTPPPLERCTESPLGSYPSRPASVPPSPATQPPLEGPGIRRQHWPRATSGAIVGFTVAGSQSPRFSPMRYGAALVRQQRMATDASAFVQQHQPDAQDHSTLVDARGNAIQFRDIMPNQEASLAGLLSQTNRRRSSAINAVVQRPLSQRKQAAPRRRPPPVAAKMAAAHS